MRRSGAPSQFNPAKRPRFAVPFKTVSSSADLVKPLADQVLKLTPVTEPHKQEKTKQENCDPVLSSKLDSCKNEVISEPVVKAVGRGFNSPLHQKNENVQRKITLPPKLHTEVKSQEESEAVPSSPAESSRYLSVMWCKNSNKKHKKWEGDAVLITTGRSVSLLDMEGKEIGKGTGYKSSDLLALKDDETLPIGGKLIQVMSVLTEEQFKSGKCFSSAAQASDNSGRLPVPEKISNKKFVNPVQDGRSIPVVQSNVSVKPRYDPDQPGALVMPRPSQSHQWQNNKKNLPVIDVVVDPYLSTHLRPHQREGVQFMYECVMGYRDYGGQGAILADDMGLGKTLQCISLIWTLFKQGPYGGKPVVKQALVITPGSLVKNWNQEFKKWLGTERLSVYCVSSEKRVELIMSLPTRRRIVLSGTPIQNDLQEFFSIVEFCNPGVLGTSGAFKRVYEGPIVASRQPEATQAEIDLGEERGAELSRLTKLFLLRRTQEINNKYLPPKCELVLFCRPSPLQLRLYRQLLNSRLFRSCLTGKFDGSPHLICIGALKKLCNHPSLLLSKAQEADECPDDLEQDSIYHGLSALYPSDILPNNCDSQHSGKLKVLTHLLEDMQLHCPKDKVVLVSNHTKTLDILEKFCEGHGYEYCRLDGQTATAKRQDIVSQFNSSYSKHFVFLLSSKAGGVGLNLIGASRLVLYDIDWNPANDLQAMARVWRDGQKKQVYIYRLLSTGTLEEKIYQRQISKQSLSGAVVDCKAKNNVQFSLDDLKDLFSLNERTDCDTHELLCCECCGTGEATRKQEEPVMRSCQLGVSLSKKKQAKNLGMDELMDWRHVKDSRNFDPAWHISGASDEISYLFWHETK